MITLTDDIKRDINSAFAEGHPVIVCGVTPEGEPTVSFRGTAQALSDNELAFWVRRSDDSTLLQSIRGEPTEDRKLPTKLIVRRSCGAAAAR